MKVNEIINEAGEFAKGLKAFSFKDLGRHLIGKQADSETSTTTARITAQQSYQKFVDTLKKNNIPLTIEAVRQYLPSWAQRYIMAGHDRDDQQIIAQYIQASAKNPELQLPAQATPQMLPNIINDYLAGMIQLHGAVMAKIEKERSLPTSTAIHPTIQNVPPGYRAEVVGPDTGGKYFKTSTQWTNELGQAVTDPASIARLDAVAQQSGQIRKIQQQPPLSQKVSKRVSRKRGQ